MKNKFRFIFLLLCLSLTTSIALASEDCSEKLKSALERLFKPKEIEIHLEKESDGFFKKIYIEAKEANMSDLPVKEVKIEASEAELNPPEEWEKGKIRLNKIKDVKFLMVITEEDLNSFLQERLKKSSEGIKSAYIKIKRERVSLVASYQVNGLPLRFLIELTGKLALEGTKIIPSEYKLYVGGLKLSDEFTTNLLERINPIFDLKTLPFPVEKAILEQAEKAITIRTLELPQRPSSSHASRGSDNPNPSHVRN